MAEPDLSFVDPDRRDEVARRIAVVTEYLKAPSRAAAANGAAEISLSVSQFYNLARSWRETGRAETVPGSKRRKTRTVDAFTPKHKALLRALEAESPQASIEHLTAAVSRAMVREGLTGFGRSAIRKRLKAIRLERSAREPAGRGLAVEHCAIDLAIEGPKGGTMAIASMVIDLERRRILGVSVGIDAPSPFTAARALRDALDRSGGKAEEATEALPVSMSVDRTPGWQRLIAILNGNGLVVDSIPVARVGGGALLSRVMGLEVFGVMIRPRQTLRIAERRRPSGRLTPKGVPANLAEAALRERLDAEHRANPFEWRLNSEARDGLLTELAAFLAI